MHPVKITLRGMERSDALETQVRERCAKLEQFFPQLIGTDVTLALEERHKQQGNNYVVKLVLQIPGNDIVIDQQRDEDAYVAVREAFDAAARRLKAVAARNRGSDRTKRHTGSEPAAAKDIE